MTKEVELIIKSSQTYDSHEDNDLEIKTAGEYYYRNHCHYILYEEQLEGFGQPVKNLLKLWEDRLEMTKKGPVNTSMVFEKGQFAKVNYQTPFGQMVLGIRTKALGVIISEKSIHVRIEYALEAEERHLADCRIRIRIHEK